MGDSFRIELNIDAFNAVRNSPEVMAELRRRAELIANQAGGTKDYEVTVKNQKTRARAYVTTVTNKARVAEARDRTLTRAIDAGRG